MSDHRDTTTSDDPPVGAPGENDDDETSPFDESRLPGRRLLHIALLFVLVGPALIWLVRPSTPSDTAPGAVLVDEPAPDFTLDLFDGTRFALSDHLATDGRPVVMNFWASWCVPCREEMPAFDAVARRHPEVLFIGVVVQDIEAAARQFAEEVAVSYPLGLDEDGVILERYPTLGLPTTWFITSDGVIAAQRVGELDEDSLESLIEEHLRAQ